MAAEATAPTINIRDLIAAGVHFGHRRRFWHPSFKKYIFGLRNDLHIIDLDKTKLGLIQASKFCHELASHGNRIMFVCTKSAGAESTREAAERCGMPYVTHRWLGGLLSNYSTVYQSVKKLDEYEERSKPENLKNLTKKEGLRLLAKLRRLQLTLSGIRGMEGLPSALFVIDAGYHHIAIKEARKIGLPVIAVVDSNFSAEGIDVVIPGNDDSSAAIDIYLQVTTDSVLAGIAEGAKGQKAEPTPRPTNGRT